MTRDNARRDDELQHYRGQLPDFTAIRDGATRALAETADEIGLGLSTADVRSLALAVVEAVGKRACLRGLNLAYDIACDESRWFHEALVVPAVEAAKTDADAAKRLNLHQQYAAGITRVRDRLQDTLLHTLREWFGVQQPVLEAPPVLPAPAPHGAAAARARAAARAGAA